MNFPWNLAPLAHWDIVGMNHYYVKGDKRLFVAMVHCDHGYCIRAEGRPDESVFALLCARAHQYESQRTERAAPEDLPLAEPPPESFDIPPF